MTKKQRRKLDWLPIITGGVVVVAFPLTMYSCKKSNKKIKDRASLNLFNKAQSELKELINSPIAKLCQIAFAQKVLNDSNKINEKSTDEEISKNIEYLNSSTALLKNMFQLKLLVNNKDSKSIDAKNSINALNNAENLSFNSIEQVESESLTLKNNIDKLKLKLMEFKMSRLVEAKKKLKAIIDSEPSKYVDSSRELQIFNDSNVEAKSTLEDIDKKIDAAIMASNDLNKKIQNYKSTKLSDFEFSKNDLSNFIANDLKDSLYKKIADKINEKIKELKGVEKKSTIKELQAAIKTLVDAKEEAIKEKAWIDKVGREIQISRKLLVDAQHIHDFLKSEQGIFFIEYIESPENKNKFKQQDKLVEFIKTKFLKVKKELEIFLNSKDNYLDSADYKKILQFNKELGEFISIANNAIKQLEHDNFISFFNIFNSKLSSWAKYCYPPKYTGVGEKLVAFKNEVQQINEELRAMAKDAKWMDLVTYNQQLQKLNTVDIYNKFREVYISEEAKKNNLAYQAIDLLKKIKLLLQEYTINNLNDENIDNLVNKLSAKNLEIEKYLSSDLTKLMLHNPDTWMKDLEQKIKEQEEKLKEINSFVSSIDEGWLFLPGLKNAFVELKQKLSILNKN